MSAPGDDAAKPGPKDPGGPKGPGDRPRTAPRVTPRSGSAPGGSASLYERYKDALRRGHVAALRGRNDAAIDAYGEAASIAPDRALPHASIGGILAKMNRPADAVASYERALALAPRDEVALRGIAETYATLGRRTAAADALDRLADTLDSGGRLADATDAARRALELAESRARRSHVEALTERLRTSSPGDEAAQRALALALLRARAGAGRRGRGRAETSRRPRSRRRPPEAEPAEATDTEADGGRRARADRSGRSRRARGREPEPEPEPEAVEAGALRGAGGARRRGPGDPRGGRRRADRARDRPRRRSGDAPATPASSRRPTPASWPRPAPIAGPGASRPRSTPATWRIALAPSDPDLHLLLAELYLDRGWRTLAVDKLLLLGRIAELDGDGATRDRLCELVVDRLADEPRAAALCA